MSNPATKPTDIVMMDAVALSRAIHAKKVSCAEVMGAYLDHIDALNPKVNAIVSLQDRGDLMQQAKARDEQLARGEDCGVMHGFPQAVKDLTATKGIRTTQGSRIFKDFVPTADAIIVERAKRAGAIIIGKTNTPEFGLGSNTYNDVFGRTLNAHDQTKTAGGSSGGGAVAVALHMLPVADGTDHGGSLRNPAAYNNIFGFRPSFGRVPAQQLDGFYAVMGTPGPMARNVPDLAMLLSVQAGYDARAPLSNEQDPAQLQGRSHRLGRRFRRAYSLRRGPARSLQGRAQDLRSARLHGRGSHSRLPDREGLGELEDPPRLAIRLGAEGALCRSGQTRTAETRSAVRGRERRQAQGLRHLRRQCRAHRLVSGRARLLRALRLLADAVRAGVSVRRDDRLAEDGRRPHHGHLSPLDGGDDPGDDVELPVAQRAGRLQQCRPADGHADRRGQPRRAACLQLANAYDQATRWVEKRRPKLLGL
jgi:hypothetical protein